MAVIGSIRKQSGLLIIMIGVALVLFLLGDLFSGGTNLFTQQEIIVGEIAGKEINQRDYEQRVQNAIDLQFGAEGANDNTRRQIRERIWREYVNELILEKEYKKLGISVSPDELLDQVQNTQPGTILYQYFTDPNTGQIIEQFRDPVTGGLDSEKVLTAIQNLLNSENKRDWLPIEAAIKEDVKMRKYNTMIGKGMYTTSVEARMAAQEKITTVSMSYVVKEFASIPDGEIEVTDADYKAYYAAHKHEQIYQSDAETRDLRYVVYDLAPSAEDIQDINGELGKLIPMFGADTNDTGFVLDHAESSLEEMIRYVPKRSLPAAIKDTIENAPVGAVVGPYAFGNKVMITKLSGIRMEPDSVTASHILIQVQDGDTTKLAAAKAKLDSLKDVAKRNNNFAELAKEFSDDLASGEKGGELGTFNRGRMVPPFEKAAFEGKVGDMPIVETQFGMHLIYITDQTEAKPNYLLSSVDMELAPSKFTSDNIYKEASRFSVTNNTAEKLINSEGVNVMPADGVRQDESMVPGIGNGSKEIVRWAYDNERSVGDVSTPFELDDKIIVVALTNIKEEGTMSLEEAKLFMKPEIVREKKKAQIMESFSSYSTLEEAAKNAGADIQRVDNAKFSDVNLPGGLGREPALIGAAMALDKGAVTPAPIEGNRGVFVLRLDGRTDAPEDLDFAAEQSSSNGAIDSRVQRAAYEALKNARGVEDNRGRYY